MEDYAKMVKKEKAEHPEFTDKQIDQIVADHLKSKDNCSQFSPDRKTRANAWKAKTSKNDRDVTGGKVWKPCDCLSCHALFNAYVKMSPREVPPCPECHSKNTEVLNG